MICQALIGWPFLDCRSREASPLWPSTWRLEGEQRQRKYRLVCYFFHIVLFYGTLCSRRSPWAWTGPTYAPPGWSASGTWWQTSGKFEFFKKILCEIQVRLVGFVLGPASSSRREEGSPRPSYPLPSERRRRRRPQRCKSRADFTLHENVGIRERRTIFITNGLHNCYEQVISLELKTTMHLNFHVSAGLSHLFIKYYFF